MVNPQVKSEGYFADIPENEIDEKLAFLVKVLPRKCTKKNYQLSKKLLQIKDSSVNVNNLQSHLQTIADRMRIHLQIDRKIKILTMTNIEGGKFERIGDLNCIYINGDLTRQSYRQKIAILAHEMSHYYLIYKHNVYLQRVEENELLTELNAIFTGFGFLLLKGYKVFESRVGNMTNQSTVGYIKESTIKKTIIKTAFLRKQNPIWILKNVGLSNLPYFVIKLFPLIIAYYQVKYQSKIIPK